MHLLNNEKNPGYPYNLLIGYADRLNCSTAGGPAASLMASADDTAHAPILRGSASFEFSDVPTTWRDGQHILPVNEVHRFDA